MYKWRTEAGRQLCQCGCGKMTKTPGSKWYHGHGKINLSERFWKKVDKGREGECWMWKAATFKESGYGQIDVEGKKRRANRVAWELTNGPIPEGMLVRHTCDNPGCVNPRHLLLGTPADNVKDMVSRGRMVSKLTSDDAVVIRAKYRQGLTYKDLAKEFGVHAGTIGKVVREESWVDA
jgi:hypothetical protein